VWGSRGPICHGWALQGLIPAGGKPRALEHFPFADHDFLVGASAAACSIGYIARSNRGTGAAFQQSMTCSMPELEQRFRCKETQVPTPVPPQKVFTTLVVNVLVEGEGQKLRGQEAGNLGKATLLSKFRVGKTLERRKGHTSSIGGALCDQLPAFIQRPRTAPAGLHSQSGSMRILAGKVTRQRRRLAPALRARLKLMAERICFGRRSI
jgi:hypothetical protein